MPKYFHIKNEVKAVWKISGGKKENQIIFKYEIAFLQTSVFAFCE